MTRGNSARLLLAACLATQSNASVNSLTKERVATVAAAGVQQLMSFFDWKLGWFGNASQGTPFWETANAVETLSSYMILTGDNSPLPAIETCFQESFKRYCPATCWFDDHLWYVHAWARAYEATGNASYLQEAETIYGDIMTKWGGWNNTCGGINWERGNAYVNAIPNELFLSASGKLARLSGNSSTPVSNYTYAEWADVDWAWFAQTPMLVPQPNLPVANAVLITDGLSTQDCSKINQGGAFWTYNQGVVLSGLSQLAAATGRADLAQVAVTIADSSIAYYSANDANVMYEVACGKDGICNGPDGKQFKGAFVRHLAYALPVMSSMSSDPTGVQARFSSWILNQTASILDFDAEYQPSGAVQFGQLWQGPFQWDNTPWVSQGSALDVLVAALMVL